MRHKGTQYIYVVFGGLRKFRCCAAAVFRCPGTDRCGVADDAPWYDREIMSNKINIRLAVIATVLAMLVGYPAYALVKNHLNGGIEKTGDGFKVDLKKLDCFAFNDMTDTAAAVPPQFAALDGQKVVLDGFVFSDSAARQLHTFQLVYNIQTCWWSTAANSTTSRHTGADGRCHASAGSTRFRN
jgi:hypothetical protein